MDMKFKCISTSRDNLTVGKVYTGHDDEIGVAFVFNDDNGEETYWTINDYSTWMQRVE